MLPLHLEKKGLRGLTIAESFKPGSSSSLLSGVVMRRDFVIDGFVFGRTTLNGDDSTDAILSMFERLHRSDISYLLVSGMIISQYNIIDLKKLHERLRIPVIGIAYNDSSGLESALKGHFPSLYGSKLARYANLGSREKILLHTSNEVFVRKEGCSTHDVACLLNGLTLQGSIPEPVRVSQLLSRILLTWSPF